MRRRRRSRAFSLTPLIDVLFILLFAALVQARNAGKSAAAGDTATPDAGAVDAGVPDAGVVDAGVPDAGVPDAGVEAESAHLARSRALAGQLAGAVQDRDVFVVEVTGAGEVSAMARWSGGREVRRDRTEYRLLRPVLPGESDEELVYPGTPEAGTRLCTVVREQMAPPDADLGLALVMVIVDAPRNELPLALYLGLREDLAQCAGDAAGVGIFLEPGDTSDEIP